MNSKSIFEKIVDGEIPSHKVYEDETVYAFLDIGPISRGHVLVIPKTRYATLDKVPAEVGAALGRVLPMLVAAVMKATVTTACNVLQNNGAAAGQTVDHVHFHIIPKYENGEGLPFQWRPEKLEDAQRLRDAIAEHVKAR